MPLAELRALVAGRPRPPGGLPWHPDYPSTDTLDVARLVLTAYEVVDGPVTSVPVWWVFQVVVNGEAVGDIGFHGPPAAGERPVRVEIGYQVVEAARGRGVATQACDRLLAYAWAHGAEVVEAGTEAGNLASQVVLRRAGFVVEPTAADLRFVARRPG